MGVLDRLFTLMRDKKASDMFFAVTSPIQIKVDGQLIPVNQQKMDNASIKAILSELVPPDRMEELEREHELNMGIPLPGVGSFRLSAFWQRGNISAVFRYIPNSIPELESLKTPPVLAEVIMEKRGLVLVVGSTGSGKSTTIAAMLDYRNRTRTGHILTLEDPVEFIFENKMSIVNQREIGSDAKTMQNALKNALRQAPDVILIGEIRDKESMGAAMAYAQSGHLVVATLHANNCYQALNRIVNFYPLENRAALLGDMAVTLRAVISQRLIPAKDGGRRAAVEVMLNTRHVAELIEKGEIKEIKDAMEKSMAPGSQTFEQALFAMIKDGSVSEEQAMAYADSASNLYWLLTQEPADKTPQPDDEPVRDASGTSFTEFTLNV
jgi:twitching motility protein PilU